MATKKKHLIDNLWYFVSSGIIIFGADTKTVRSLVQLTPFS